MVQEIADGVLVETAFRGVTIGAVRTDMGYVLIDTPAFPNDARQWHDRLREYADLPICAVVMLDAHRDRMLGPSWYKPFQLIAHTATHKAVTALAGTYVSTLANLLTSSPAEQTSLLTGKILKPTVTFTERMRLRLGKTVLELSHQPGPAQGSIWVYLAERGILFAGDSVVVETPPYLNSPYSQEWVESLKTLRRDMRNVTIVPGRGDVITDQDVTEPLLKFLQLARERVQSLYETQSALSDTARIIHELLALFPPPLEFDLEVVQQRVRTGLQFIYNEFREQELGPMGADGQDEDETWEHEEE